MIERELATERNRLMSSTIADCPSAESTFIDCKINAEKSSIMTYRRQMSESSYRLTGFVTLYIGCRENKGSRKDKPQYDQQLSAMHVCQKPM